MIIGFLVWYFMLRDDTGTDTPEPTETTELLLPFLALGPKGMLEVSKIRSRK